MSGRNRGTRSVVLSAVAMSVAFGAAVFTQATTRSVKPSKEFRDLMISNTAIVAVDGRSDAISGSISERLKTDDYDAVLKDTATLRANFEKIQAFFAARKSEGAVAFTKSGLQAIAAMEEAAKAKDKERTFKSQVALATACRNCHVKHRVNVVTVPLQFEIR
jgi:hypothetical protein